MNIRRITTFTFVLAIAALIVGLSACDQLVNLILDLEDMPPEDMPPATGLSGEIPVGVVLPETGRFGEVYGVPMKQGFELALQEINHAQIGDATIMLITADSQETIDGAVAAFNKLIHEDEVPAILGPAFSSQAEETFPLAQENQVVAFSPTSSKSGLSGIGDFIFRAGLATDVFIPSGVMATQEKLGYQRVATIYDASDAYSTDSDEVVRKALADNNVEVLATETFQGGDTDFSEQLTRIMELNPDALFISALSVEMTAVLIQGRQLIPSSVHFIVPELTITEVQGAGTAADGAISFAGWASTADTPGNQAFIHNYQAMYGTEPNAWAAQSYATLHILAEAIANAQSTDSTAIRDALAMTMDFDIVLGKFSFDANGEAVYNPIILIVENGALQLFE